MKKLIVTIILVILTATGVAFILYLDVFNTATPKITDTQQKSDEQNDLIEVDFSKINADFLFSATIDQKYRVQYLPELKAINIYNPNIKNQSNLENSVIYLSFFKADRFLTLNTVDISLAQETIVAGHDAVLYQITQKPSVNGFLGQPSWRKKTHKALDIRYLNEKPTYFYSFAYSPALSQTEFDSIIDSLKFH